MMPAPILAPLPKTGSTAMKFPAIFTPITTLALALFTGDIFFTITIREVA